MFELEFTESAIEDLRYLKKAEQNLILDRTLRLPVSRRFLYDSVSSLSRVDQIASRISPVHSSPVNSRQITLNWFSPS